MTRDVDHPRPPPIAPDGVGEPTIPPVVRELFKLLPPIGSQWPHEDRGAFMEALKATFDLVYGSNNLSASLPKPQSRTRPDA